VLRTGGNWKVEVSAESWQTDFQRTKGIAGIGRDTLLAMDREKAVKELEQRIKEFEGFKSERGKLVNELLKHRVNVLADMKKVGAELE
jgi:prefoldin subunit 5